MLMNSVTFDGRPPIESYGGGGFRIGGAVWTGAVLIMPDRIAPWPAATPLSPACFGEIVADAGAVDILLVGVGPEIAPLPRAVREALDAAGLGYDAMATPAACRTFNVLLAEERRVAAALLPV